MTRKGCTEPAGQRAGPARLANCLHVRRWLFRPAGAAGGLLRGLPPLFTGLLYFPPDLLWSSGHIPRVILGGLSDPRRSNLSAAWSISAHPPLQASLPSRASCTR